MTTLPIVLVHGIRLSGACWTTVAEQVAPRHPVTTVDLPGHGIRRGEQFTLSAAVEAVHECIDRVGGKALVVGHSLGGYVSAAAAAADPALVAGLVLAGSTGIPSRPRAMPFTLMHRLLSRRPDGGDRISGRLFDAVLPARVAQDIRRGGIATEAIPDVVAALRDFDLLGNLGRYPGPTWIVNGGHDHFRFNERQAVAASPQGRLLVIPGAGHYFPLAQPAVFSRLLLDTAAACRDC